MTKETDLDNEDFAKTSISRSLYCPQAGRQALDARSLRESTINEGSTTDPKIAKPLWARKSRSRETPCAKTATDAPKPWIHAELIRIEVNGLP